jgi:hypothetical protein
MEGGHFPMLERPSELVDRLIASLEPNGPTARSQPA